MSHWFQLLSIYLRIAMSDTEIAWYFVAFSWVVKSALGQRIVLTGIVIDAAEHI